MNIRPLQAEDINVIVDIWLEGSVKAHHFIDCDYWVSSTKKMKDEYLPNSKTYVLEEDNVIIGFLSMVEDYLAALFIDVTQQHKGYGKRLLEYIKQHHDSIQLKVYQNNLPAVAFYLKNDFRIIDETVDPPTSQAEFVMEWKRK